MCDYCSVGTEYLVYVEGKRGNFRQVCAEHVSKAVSDLNMLYEHPEFIIIERAVYSYAMRFCYRKPLKSPSSNRRIKMGQICEHEFERSDPNDPDYSLIEYDLYAKLGLTIRKNFKLNRYEIVTISKPRIIRHSSDSIETIASIANDLEGAQNTTVECGSLCPKRKR